MVLCSSQVRAMPLLEEIITIPALKDSHQPLKNVRALQFPNLWKVENEGWPYSNDRFCFDKKKSYLYLFTFLFFFPRIFFNKPATFNHTANCVLSLFLLGPFYRLYFWITVPTVTVNIVKSFSTQKYAISKAEDGIYLFINIVQDFVLKKYSDHVGYQIVTITR